MTRYAYITTTARAHEVNGLTEAPKEPEGEGWEFLGTSANITTRYFEWRRPLVDEKAKKQ